ncbi:MAG: hypothetical protein WBA13_16925 [Microcoleaceae cyanobacterium]
MTTDLNQQISALIQNAPADGKTPDIVAAIAPGLKMIAQQLQHLQYYILQAPDGRWVLTTLSNLKQPNLEKRVIYAYPSVEDASAQIRAAQTSSSPTTAAILPVISILFQIVAIPNLDSIIFFETPGQIESGTEVKKEEIQNLIRSYLQQYQITKSRSIPPNLA